VKKKNVDNFDPNFTCCPNQYSSPANDMINSMRAIERETGYPNPDKGNFDRAGEMWTKKAAMRMDVIINEANGE
jgi:hypothetical protein